jgi:hypothetical protein
MALGKSAGSSSFRMSMNSQLPYAVGLARLHAHGWDPLVPMATGVYEGLQRGCLVTSSGGVNIKGTLLARIGWACGVAEKGSDWLGS